MPRGGLRPRAGRKPWTEEQKAAARARAVARSKPSQPVATPPAADLEARERGSGSRSGAGERRRGSGGICEITDLPRRSRGAGAAAAPGGAGREEAGEKIPAVSFRGDGLGEGQASGRGGCASRHSLCRGGARRARPVGPGAGRLWGSNGHLWKHIQGSRLVNTPCEYAL